MPTTKTARLHLENVLGYGGYARCYEVTPPIFDNGFAFGFLTIVVHPEREHANAEVLVFHANRLGQPAETSLRRRAGSFTPLGDPHAAQHHMDGCFTWALAACGYAIEGYGDKPLQDGLDYDPDSLEGLPT
ncbi:hypothetical protein [Nocardia jiangxiensis]|uniref:hypothetical protein n=1 Tax=Nocardia jiangxiensis TaxID=282685 RepID=UPI0002DB5D68|nr:hypothetical protein [Nocardia jiangxiensis]